MEDWQRQVLAEESQAALVEHPLWGELTLTQFVSRSWGRDRGRRLKEVVLLTYHGRVWEYQGRWQDVEPLADLYPGLGSCEACREVMAEIERALAGR